MAECAKSTVGNPQFSLGEPHKTERNSGGGILIKTQWKNPVSEIQLKPTNS